MDILGFAELSRRAPATAQKIARRFRKELMKQVKSRSYPRYETRPRIAGISDALFVTIGAEPLSPPTPDDLRRLITDLSDTMYQCIKKRKPIPIRGSINIGDVDQEPLVGASGDHLVGKSVTEAVLFESAQEWVGISFVPNQSPLYNPLFDQLENDGFLISWPVPTRSGLKMTKAIAWPRTQLDDALARISTLYDNHIGKRGEEKYYSTRIFLEHQIRRSTE